MRVVRKGKDESNHPCVGKVFPRSLDWVSRLQLVNDGFRMIMEFIRLRSKSADFLQMFKVFFNVSSRYSIGEVNKT